MATLCFANDELLLLVHQLRNPLAALRTFGQLLRRRLDGDARNLSLVDSLLGEQRQISRYVEAIDHLTEAPALVSSDTGTRLLLPPALSQSEPQSLEQILRPLLERATATANLQGRPWQAPTALPDWQGDGNAIGEIVANLLENAFRYSRSGGAIGRGRRRRPVALAVALPEVELHLALALHPELCRERAPELAAEAVFAHRETLVRREHDQRIVELIGLPEVVE